jgi:hypothetical protein
VDAAPTHLSYLRPAMTQCVQAVTQYVRAMPQCVQAGTLWYQSGGFATALLYPSRPHGAVSAVKRDQVIAR